MQTLVVVLNLWYNFYDVASGSFDKVETGNFLLDEENGKIEKVKILNQKESKSNKQTVFYKREDNKRTKLNRLKDIQRENKVVF